MIPGNGKQLRIAVLFGGRSVEHEVSIITAHQVMDALEVAGYGLLPIYIDKEGVWFAGDPLRNLPLYSKLPSAGLESVSGVYRVSLSPDRSIRELMHHPQTARSLFRRLPVLWADVFFPAVHGTTGEDGALQGLFELADVAYTGCGIFASAVSLNKVETKRILKSAEIPVLAFETVTRERWASGESECLDAAEKIGTYPLMVKPANLGSSIGVTRAKNRQDMADAIALALELDQLVLVEKALEDFYEINCSVMTNGVASVCELPCTTEALLTFDEKYKRGGSKGKGKASGGSKAGGGMASLQRIVPAPIAPELSEAVRAMASLAYRTIGGAGVARIDFLYDRAQGKLFLNEINTLPGSLSYYLWEASTVSFDRLVRTVVEEGLARHAAGERTRHRFEANLLSGG